MSEKSALPSVIQADVSVDSVILGLYEYHETADILRLLADFNEDLPGTDGDRADYVDSIRILREAADQIELVEAIIAERYAREVQHG